MAAINEGDTGLVARSKVNTNDSILGQIDLDNHYPIKSDLDLIGLSGVVTDATTINITALGSCTLVYNGFINFGARKVIFNGTTAETVVIVSNNQRLDIGFTTNADSLYEFVDCDLLVRFGNHLAPAATNGVFDVSNSAGNEKKNSFQMFNTFVDGSKGGTFTDLATVSIYLPSFVGNTSTGLDFNGGFIRIAIHDTQFEGVTGDMINIVGVTFDSFTVSDGVVESDGVNVFIRGDAGDANVNAGGTATVNNVRNEGGFEPILVGVSVKDLQWLFEGNPGFQSTQFIGNTNVTTPADTIIGVQGVFVQVAGTTTEFADNSHFAQFANMEMEHIGLQDRDIKIQVNFASKRASGSGAQDVVYSVFKDSGGGYVALDPSTDFSFEIDGAARGGSILVRDFASEGDKYSVFVKNDSSTQNIATPTLQLDCEAR